jgi:putative tricarboxylic transport membrane protein
MLLFGVVGYLFTKLRYPLAPLVLAIVIGDKAEEAFRQAMLTSQGSLTIFWSNWLVGSLMAVGMALLLWPFAKPLADRMGARTTHATR